MPVDDNGIVHRGRNARLSEPEGALLLFHGRGADEDDLAPLFDYIDPDGRLVGATPRGPLALPPGGAHWYAIRAVGFPDPQTFGDTFARLERWLDAFLERTGVPIERTILGGFSQGAVMAYALSLGAGRARPAGLIAMSGFMPEVDGFEFDLEARRDFPVAIAHGILDPVISVEFSRTARRRLEAAGATILYRESRMPHTIDPRFLDELGPWVHEVIPPGEGS